MATATPTRAFFFPLSSARHLSSPSHTTAGARRSCNDTVTPLRHASRRHRPTSLLRALPHGVTLPLVPASDHWGNWTVLLATAALGIWSEKSTRAGKALSGALVTVLLGLAASTVGLVAADAPTYRVVLEYLLPLAVPLLLYTADLRRVLRSTGALLLAFLLGSGTLPNFFSELRSAGSVNYSSNSANDPPLRGSGYDDRHGCGVPACSHAIAGK
jgi:hypothetical protein